MAFGRVQERRAHPRSKMRVEAKLMLADRRELGCTITDVSANGIAVLARESGAVGEMVVVYVAEAGRLQGQIVRVFDGGSKEVGSATASPSGGSWKTAALAKALSSGSYSATATQPSSLGNPDGKSAVVTFTVNTAPPVVTLDQPAIRSSVNTPSFTGATSESTPVTINPL